MILLSLGLLFLVKAWLDGVTSEFVVTSSRVLIKYGFIRRRTLELMLSRIESVGVDQSVIGRLLGFGTIIVSGTGGTREKFPALDDPLEFRWYVQAATSGDTQEMEIRRQAREDLAAPLPERIERRIKLVSLILAPILCIAAFWLFRNGIAHEPAETMVGTEPQIAALNTMSESQNAGVDDPAPVTASEPPAENQSIPQYDSVGYCSGLANRVGGSYTIEKTCRESEANAEQSLAEMEVPARVNSYCSRIAGITGGSYRLYKSCVEREMEAASQM